MSVAVNARRNHGHIALQALLEAVPEEAFRSDLSSTTLRTLARASRQLESKRDAIQVLGSCV